MMMMAKVALFAVALMAPGALRAEMPYSGPKPAQKDLPYLVLGNRLVETEQAEARQSEEKNRTTYSVSGATSSARTPLAEPAFLLLPGNLKPESLSLYPMRVDKGNRSVSLAPSPAKTIRGPFRCCSIRARTAR